MKGHKKTTINEIAKMAGVSSAAVSRYLNNGYISDEKREQIRKVIEETGYQPSLQAQMLRTKKTKLIHVILTASPMENRQEILTGISRTLNHEGYDILLSVLDDCCTSSLATAITGTKARGTDAILFITDLLQEGMREILQKSELPVLLCGTTDTAFSSVCYDNAAASEAITNALLSQGSCKTAYIGITPNYPECGARRFEGYKNALTKKGIPMDTKLIKICDNSIADGFQATESLIKICSGIDGIICGTDLLAAGARKYLMQHQTSCQILLTSFGNTELRLAADPVYASVFTDGELLGQAAATQLTTNLATTPDSPVHTILMPEIISDTLDR